MSSCEIDSDSGHWAALFSAIQNIDIDQLAGKDLSTVLPFLAKLLLSKSFVRRQQLLKLLYPIREMNGMLDLMLSKNNESYEAGTAPPISSFESCSSVDRLRIVAAEYLRIQDQARQSNFTTTTASTAPKLMQSDLFDTQIYLDDISYCLSVLLIKSSGNSVINIIDMSEALLHVKFGPIFILRLVVNMPDRCQELCHSLVTYGERLDEGANFNEIAEHRAKTLRMLCIINPSIAFTVRAVTLQMCKMPSLTIMITLDQLDRALLEYEDASNESDDHLLNQSDSYRNLEDTFDSAIAFITGILLGVDEATRTWFSQYTKSAQQKRIDQGHFTVLSKFRSHILAFMNRIFPILLEEDYASDQSADKSSLSDKNDLKSNPKDLNKKLIRATATLRLFCALRGIGSIKLNPEESDLLLRLITCKPPVNQTSVNFATTGVCTLLACSALINNQKEERRAAEWLKWLIKESNYSDNRYSSHGKCSISELLLLIAIHFQNNQNNQIAELICATLSMKLQIKASVSKCKSLFVQEVFNDQMVAEHAVRVPVTRNLSNDITEFLPVHCIHQLLESRSFSKHQVPINDWIYHQICESKKPIHNILPKLIEAYVNSIIIPTSAQGHCGTNQPLSEDEIARVYEIQLYSINRQFEVELESKKAPTKKPGRKKVEREKTPVPMDVCDDGRAKLDEPKIVDVETAQVLLLYYLVLYEDVRLKKHSDLSATDRAKMIKYGPDFMMEIPVFYLLQLVRDNQNSFGSILPDLLKLVTAQYPQLCSIQHWLTVEHYEPHSPETSACIFNKRLAGISSGGSLSKSTKSNRESYAKQLNVGFKNMETDPVTLTRTISSILILPNEEIWPFVNIFISNFSKILSLNTSSNMESKKLIKSAIKLWWKFNSIFPRKLWVMTVNSLNRPQNLRMSMDVKPVEYSWDELALDPLIALRCDDRVFRCVDILNIVMHILSAFLAASRRCLQDQINEHPSRQRDVRNLEELRATLILAQTSAAIQILLESCIPSQYEQEALSKREACDRLDEGELLLLDRFDASVNCICEHLHQVFIADTNLAKLVHFQTYPSELLATTSEKIPSMHICLDFIPELLSQPDLAKQVFVIELTSHLCEKYAITKSLNVAKLCFNVAFTLLQLLPSERRALFFIPVLPALLRICKVFPILREDADIILAQTNQITIAHVASTSSRLSLGSAKPFEGLEQMSWREVRTLMGTFCLHEALYLCIQKCTLDLNQLKESCKQEDFISNSLTSVYKTVFAYGSHVINPPGS